MAIDRITSKIKADADAEAKQIELEADRSIEVLNIETAKRVTRIEQEAGDDAAGAARDQKIRMISRARAEMRTKLLEEKQKLINQVFQQALESVVALDDDQYAALMKKLLLEAVETGDEEVIIAEPDGKRKWTEILAGANDELARRGLKGHLVLSDERRSMAGGFVLRKGKKEINCNVSYLLKSLREDLESEVVEVLFSTTESTGS